MVGVVIVGNADGVANGAAARVAGVSAEDDADARTASDTAPAATLLALVAVAIGGLIVGRRLAR